MNNVFEKFQAISRLIIVLAILKIFFATCGVGNDCVLIKNMFELIE